MATKENPSGWQAAPGQGESVSVNKNNNKILFTSQAIRQAVLSGFGGYHTANPAAKNPRPYTTITIEQIMAMAANPNSVAKDQAQWIIPSTTGGPEARGHAFQRENGTFWALWADLDDVAGMTFQDVTEKIRHAIPGTMALIYTSRSATEDKPKSRVLIPLAAGILGADYSMRAKIFNNRLEAAGLTPDRVTERTGQLCYLPNRGEYYQYHIIEGELLNPSVHFAQEIQAEQERLKAEAEEREQRHRESLQKIQARIDTGQADPMAALNIEYPPELMLARYGHTLQRNGKWLPPNSESGNAGGTTKDGKWHFHNGCMSMVGQPAKNGGTWGDSFDLFTWYEHGGGRDRALKAAGDMFYITDPETNERITITKLNQRQFKRDQENGADPADDFQSIRDQGSTIDPSRTAARAEQILKDRAAPAQFDTAHLPDDFRHYVAEICDRTNTDPITIVMAVLVSISALVGIRAYIPEDVYFSRLFALIWGLIQDSSGAFKTTGLNKGSRLIWQRVSEIQDSIKFWEKEKLSYEFNPTKEEKENINELDKKIKKARYLSPLMPNKASAEGLLELMANEQRGAILCGEFGEWLLNMSKTHNIGLKALFTELFDVPQQYSYMTRGGGNMITQRPYISIIGLSTPQWVQDNISLGDVGSGFFARFLLFAPPEKRVVPPALPRYTTPIDDSFEQKIKSNLATIEDRAFELTPEASEAFEQIHQGIYEALVKQCTKEEQELLDPYAKRWSPYVLKLAMLFQIMDDPARDIGIDAIIPAAALVDYAMESTIYLFRGNLGLSPFQRNCEAVLKYVAKRSGSVTRKVLLSSRILEGGAKEYDEILTMLLEGGKLNIVPAEKGGKREEKISVA